MPSFPLRRPAVTALALSTAVALCALLAVAAGPRPERVTYRQPELSADEAPAGEVADARRGRLLHEVGVADWHKAGHLGRGVKVAILDSGFRGWRDALGQQLPASVEAKSFRRDGQLEARDSQHGILCGEVIHELAPEAGLLFANWEPGQPDSFLEAVRWARSQGAAVISCSVIAPSWSDGEGGGPVHRKLTEALGTGKDATLLFASAGNTAKRHWGGTFAPGEGGLHQWEAGQADNELSPYVGETSVSVELSAPAEARYELAILAGDTVAAVSKPESGLCPGSVVARFEPKAGQAYRLRVRHLGGPAGSFHVVSLGGTLGVVSARGGVPFPADGAEVVAVGAVDSKGGRASYSACGPCAACPKPDLMATVPFPTRLRGKSFAGTSAAAPQAAALAAVLWGARPGWTAAKVREAMAKAASDLGPAGHDCETGFGLARLPDVVAKE